MKILADLPRNSRNCIKYEPMWSVFGGMILFYAPIYMKALGVTEIEMGLINTINLMVAFVFHFFAAPIANRVGRKKTTLIFDLISWSIPMLIWAVSQNFWYFLVAYTINATVRVVGVSWFCLLIEDARNDQRAHILSIINIINYAAGMFTPITGLLIAKYGTIPTLRVLYMVGMVSMTAMFLIRNFFVEETKVGKEILEKNSGLSIRDSLKSYFKNIMGILHNKSLVLITLIYILTSFTIPFNFFQALYINNFLGFNEKLLSLTPFIGAFINLMLFFFILPKLKSFGDERILIGSLLISSIGFVLLVLTPKANLLFMLTSVAVIAAGNFLMMTHRDAIFINRIGDHEKADVFAAVQTLTTLLTIPSGFIGGLLFSLSPRLPFLLISTLFLIALSICVLLLRSDVKTSLDTTTKY